VVSYLEGKGLFRGTHDNPMRLGISSRSKDVIEPVLKPQWWVACKGMADASCEAVHNGKLTIVPKVGGMARGCRVLLCWWCIASVVRHPAVAC
jgi:valyl-tRNA synthetase